MKARDTPASVAHSIPDTDMTFPQAFPMPGVVLLMGQRGQGKTATAYWAVDRWHGLSKGRVTGAIYNAPRAIREGLPDWVLTPTSLTKLPHNSVVVIDEAQQVAHARRAASKENLVLANLVSLSRQRNQLLIVITHHSRKLDVMDVMEANRVIWKMPTRGHLMFERDQIKPFTKRAINAFDLILERKKDTRKYAYVMDFESLSFGMVKTGLPPWWIEAMSYSMA